METRKPKFAGMRSWLELLWIKRYQACLDTVVMCLALILAYQLIFGFKVPGIEGERWRHQLPYVILAQWIIVQVLGIHRLLWRYIGLAEVNLFIKAALWSIVPVALICVGGKSQPSAWQVQLSIVFLNVLFAFGGLLSVRVLWRLLCESKLGSREEPTLPVHHQRKRVLLIGAGAAGERAVSEIAQGGSIEFDIRGFVDDDRSKQQSIIHGVRVLGTISDLPKIATDLRIDQAIITMSQCPREEFRRILTICGQIPMKIRIIPSLNEIINDNVKVSRIRDIGIADLLGREPIQLTDDRAREFIGGKCVMVTGAGGSIGAELVRRAARYQPSALLLVERSEFALFTIDNEIRAAWPGLHIVPVLADVSSRSRVIQIFKQYRPNIVLHAAAHKHVPLIENNVTEAITNNVVATQIMGEQAAQNGVEVFVLISSDKAVRPKSVMGASKRISELIVQEFDRRSHTQFVTVRFGNVIGSAGSVVPNFEEQIRKGGPVTVTHPEMQRFFMTIPEAAQLVLEAAAMGEGGEMFVLDMGKPVRVLDLAKEMILLSGLRPFEDIDIVYTGIRPGEKLFEEVACSDESLSKTRHPKIFIGLMSGPRGEEIFHAVERLIELSGQGNETEIKRLLSELIPEAQFEPTKPAVPDIDRIFPPHAVAESAAS